MSTNYNHRIIAAGIKNGFCRYRITKGKLPQQVHLTPAFGKELISLGRALLDGRTVQHSDHTVQINSVGQLIAKFILAIPCIFCDVPSDPDRAQLIFSDLPDDLAADGHDLDLEIVGYLRTG